MCAQVGSTTAGVKEHQRGFITSVLGTIGVSRRLSGRCFSLSVLFVVVRQPCLSEGVLVAFNVSEKRDKTSSNNSFLVDKFHACSTKELKSLTSIQTKHQAGP